MANIEIKHLVNLGRFSDNEVKILLAIVYLPIGLLLMVFRSILTLLLLILGQILPDTPANQTFLNNLTCWCFGITVSVENCKMKENVEVFISNSLSIFDHVAVSKAIGNLLPLNKTPLQHLLGFRSEELGTITNAETFKRSLETITKDKKTPVIVSPEDSPTNGNALLKFNSKYFKFFQKVQPLCITIKRPLLNISVSCLGSTYMQDVIFFMFSPFTNYQIKFLPSMEKKSLSEDEFADIVRQNIASEMKVEATSFSASDVTEWSKRRLIEQRRRQQERMNAPFSTPRYQNPEIARMAALVKEVLPHVPLNAICNDLAVTRSVDTTITNILEGRVRFISEPIRPQVTSSTSLATPTKRVVSTLPPSQLSMGASSFGKTANERTKSFQERKEQLIAAARRRYIEKHNLDIPL